MTLFAIHLARHKNETEFETFMETEIFPAVDKHALRTGQVSRLLLWKGDIVGHTHEYLWQVEGTIGGGAARSHLSAIEAFGATVKPMADFAQCLKWEADSLH